MFQVRYDARVIEGGKLVVKKRFKHKDAALNWAKDKLVRHRQVKVSREQVHVLTVIQNTEWGIAPHDPWQRVDGPLARQFWHTSVTKQLPESATIAAEKEQMRSLDAIARSRGFNGISYSYVIFPSGRVYEGRGWLVVEAATEGHNTTSDSICFGGNTDAFKPTKAQLISAEKLTNNAQNQGVFVKTGLQIDGHRKVAPKACPGRFVTDDMMAAAQRRVNAA